MKKLLPILFFLLLSCTDERGARETLRGMGYTNIQITGFSPFVCSEDDTFSTGFVATGPTGKQVRGAVCSGVLKGHTVRFE